MKRALALLAVGSLAACGRSGTAGGAGASSAVSASGPELFAARCQACHGPAGKGDGPAAAGLQPKPRDLSDPSWQAGVTDDHLRKVIVEGGGAVGRSPLMPPQGDLKDQPAVVEKLVQVVRGFAVGK